MGAGHGLTWSRQASVPVLGPRGYVQGYLQKHDVGYAVGLDDAGRILNAYAVREPPVVVVGRDGRLIRGWRGGVDAATLRAVLDELVTLPAQ